MDHQELIALTDSYKETLEKEREARLALNTTLTAMEKRKVFLLNLAYATGKIDGKNAEIRSNQEKLILADDEDHASYVSAKAGYESLVSLIEVDRRYLEAVMSLTKAWLYSQSGRVD